jgi:hypothetical protein
MAALFAVPSHSGPTAHGQVSPYGEGPVSAFHGRKQTGRNPPEVVVPDLSNVAERLSGRPAQSAARRLPNPWRRVLPGARCGSSERLNYPYQLHPDSARVYVKAGAIELAVSGYRDGSVLALCRRRAS